MIWIAGVVLFLLYSASGALPTNLRFPGIQPLFEVGPLKMDWRDILALLIVGIVIYGLHTGQLSARDALIIVGSILAGKAVGK
jgi:hypothetical protein